MNPETSVQDGSMPIFKEVITERNNLQKSLESLIITLENKVRDLTGVVQKKRRNRLPIGS